MKDYLDLLNIAEENIEIINRECCIRELREMEYKLWKIKAVLDAINEHIR